MTDFTPPAIEAYLRRFVIGQDASCKTIAVAVSNHLRRQAYREAVPDGIPLQKANVMIVGPTGTGKTHIVRSLAQYLEVPFASVAATAITQSGFAGLDPDYAFQALWMKTGGDKALAERGIVHIDEVDKIARKSSDDRDKSQNLTTGVGVQQALLDVLDAREVTLTSDGPYRGKKFNGAGVLFLLSGAFIGIDRIVSRRIAGTAGAARPQPLSQTETLRRLEASDLIAYGMIPEFVGRCPILVPMRPLTYEDILRILTEPYAAPAAQMRAIAQGAGGDLILDGSFLSEVAREAVQAGTGARSLMGELHKRLEETFKQLAPGRVAHVSAAGVTWTENNLGAPAVNSLAGQAGPPEVAASVAG